MTCRIPECDRRIRARGLCGAHYERDRSGRPLDPPVRHRASRVPDFCTVDECDRPHAARGYCSNHYKNWLKHGRPVVQRRRPKCGTVAGARRHHRNKTPLCSPCRRAWRDYQREYARQRRGFKRRYKVEKAATIKVCALDVLETYWPDSLTTFRLVSRIREIHPEWQEENIRRVLTRDVVPLVEHDTSGDENTFRAKSASWAEAS